MVAEGKNKSAIILLVFTLLLLLVGSTDGWLRVQPPRCDSMWFYMCGKSWMSGLIPYQDFTDSKGPLLWLIYGLGYLISPHNFYGVFVFQLLFYWATFYVLYRTAFIVLRKENVSILAAMLMGLLYFYPGMHEEILTEDYCHLFDAIALYLLIKALYSDNYKSLDAFWFGVVSGAALMIKYH